MKYQLVIQFPATSIADYDALVELETVIINSIGQRGAVDGHDMGCGEMNVLIYTDHPAETFRFIQSVLGTRDFAPTMKAAFREIESDEFTVLYPPGETEFSVS